MSALDPSVIISKVIHCYDPVTGVAELKGGVNWVLGNDTTGDGRATVPYATLEQAIKEVRTHEAQEETTQNWEFRLVTDPLEASTYGNVDHNDDADFPSSPTFYFFFRGWLKTWGDQPHLDISKRIWEDNNDKPEVGHFERTVTTNAFGPYKQVWLDIVFNNMAKDFDVSLNTSTAGGFIEMIGCIHKGTATQTVKQAFNNTNADAQFMACTFLNRTMSALQVTTAKNIIVPAINCFWYNTTVNCCEFGYQTSGGQPLNRIINTNCIIIADGFGIFCLINTLGTSILTVVDDEREHNSYWLQGGAEWMQATVSLVIPNFTPVGNPDSLSREGDPDTASINDPVLNDTSPIIDKGGFFIGKFDKLGLDLYNFDALGVPWGDSLNFDTPSSGPGKFSQRGVGPIQHRFGLVINGSQVVAPLNVVNFDTPYVVGEVGLNTGDQDTCHAKITQASDSAAINDRLEFHSAPLNIPSTKNKLDISEDGGGDVAITITVDGYRTTDLHTELQTQLNGAGLTGTYTVAYNQGTMKTTISATGLTSGFEIKFGTGANAAENCSIWFGYEPSDQAQTNSLVGTSPVEENNYISGIIWEQSSIYVAGQNPATTGAPWVDIGTADPIPGGGVEGTNGVDCTGPVRFVRANIGDFAPLPNKLHGYQDWNGNLRTPETAG